MTKKIWRMLPKKLLELINEFGKVAEYKSNTHKSVVFLYSSKKQSEREIKETIPFTTASKRKKIPRNKPTQTGKRSENCKMLMKETEDDTNEWQDLPCSLVEASILSKQVYFPKQSTDSV